MEIVWRKKWISKEAGGQDTNTKRTNVERTLGVAKNDLGNDIWAVRHYTINSIHCMWRRHRREDN